MPEKIIMNSGLKEYEVVFEDRDNESVIIKFNPTDLNLAKRFEDFMDDLDKQLDTLKEIELDEDGFPVDDSFKEDISILDNAIRSGIDKALGNKVSDKLFMTCNPLTRINGETFIEQFCTHLSNIIESEAEKSSGKALDKEKLKRYGEKYAVRWKR